jgi:hypothetical protein
MNAIIILSVIAVFLINIVFIDEIYKIIEPPTDNFFEINQYKKQNIKNVLIYGDKAISIEIADILIRQHMTSDILTDFDNLDKSCKYNYMLAINNDDLENLTACSIASKLMDIEKIVAICNKYYNKKIYEENNIFCLMSESSASEIVSALLNLHNKKEA